MDLALKRFAETPNSTASTLWHGEKFICFCIEDGYRAVKVKGETRIPAGRYKLQKATDTRFNAAYKVKYGYNWVMRVLNVPNFEGIEIHIGNAVENTDGCLLTNMEIGFASQFNNFYGTNSVRAMRLFYEYLDPIQEDIYLNIIDPT